MKTSHFLSLWQRGLCLLLLLALLAGPGLTPASQAAAAADDAAALSPSAILSEAQAVAAALDDLTPTPGGSQAPLNAEIGADDFRISEMGNMHDRFEMYAPAVAYNSTDNQYLVVWQGDYDILLPEFEIYGQLVDALTGLRLGDTFPISDMGPANNTLYNAYYPEVAYNSQDNQYLVVWQGDDNTGALVNDEHEIFGQLLDAGGNPVGADDFRISNMGPDGDPNYDAIESTVAYNSIDNRYLVAWRGDDHTAPLVDNEYEIFIQILNADGTGYGINDLRISSMGSDGSVSYVAATPAATYNSTTNEYLVVWWGDDNTGTLVSGEREIFGQRLSAAGAQVGADDFRISSMGPEGSTAYGAYRPAVAYNSTDNEYLVAWYGDDNTAPLVDNEYEIFGQRLNAAGVEVGIDDFRISSMGPDGDMAYEAYDTTVAYNSLDNEYLVTWVGDDHTPPLVNNEYEIFGQRLDASTGAGRGDRIRISQAGPDGDENFAAFDSVIVFSSAAHEYLVTWVGDDKTDPPVYGNYIIFGQRLDAAGAEVGEDDAWISAPGQDTLYDANSPAVAYNSQANEYLVVWVSDDNTHPLVSDENEVYGQRLDGNSGARVGERIRISDVGPDGDWSYNAYRPAVAYNSQANEYLVVWHGDDNLAPLVDGEYEIFGQRLDASGAEIGANDFRISFKGPDGNANYDSYYPDVVYNSLENEYLVTWTSDDSLGGLVNDEYEIYGQRLDAAGSPTGQTGFRISSMGSDGDATYSAGFSRAAYNPTENEYLVVWVGDNNLGALADGEYEIYGQRLTAAGVEVGEDDFRISSMGPDGNADYAAGFPSVAYNSADNEYLVVWFGDDDTAPLVDDDIEVFGQRLNAAGVETGVDDFRISSMGADGDSRYNASFPHVAYDVTLNEYLVVWSGDDGTPPLVDDEFEIYGQRLDASGNQTGEDDFRLSSMGPDGNMDYEADEAAVVYNSTDHEYLLVWDGDDDTPPLADGEHEIFGQRYALRADLALAAQAAPDPAGTEEAMTYTLNVTNLGVDAAKAASLSVTLPAGVVYGSASGAGWACTHNAGVVTCTRAAVNPGESAGVSVSVTTPATAGEITMHAVVSSLVQDTQPANNSASVTVSVLAGGPGGLYLPMMFKR